MILESFPHEAIAECNTEHEFALFALGASGHSGLKERLLESTTGS
jgi:nucleotide-binding universal stress UspA family protein